MLSLQTGNKMTRKDDSPEEAKDPYWSDELLAVLAQQALGDEDRARQTLEKAIQQAREGMAMRTLSTERLLAGYLIKLYGHHKMSAAFQSTRASGGRRSPF